MPGKTATLPDVDKTLKNARVELKTSPDAKNRLREAAQAVGLDLSAFILSAAMERAESVLDNQRRRELSNQSWELMNQLIAEPAQPTLALKALMKRKTAMVDKHEEITLPIVLSCNYQSDITYPGQKQFDCGNPVIDKFVRASLKRSVRNSDCAAKALIDRQSGELIGICTFTAYSLEKQRVSGVLQGSQPSEIGVVRLVMLGVARKYQKRGFGQDLLCDF